MAAEDSDFDPIRDQPAFSDLVGEPGATGRAPSATTPSRESTVSGRPHPRSLVVASRAQQSLDSHLGVGYELTPESPDDHLTDQQGTVGRGRDKVRGLRAAPTLFVRRNDQLRAPIGVDFDPILWTHHD